MNNLKDLRKMSGRKQADVAAEVGISREYLSALENGRQKLKRPLADKLAAAYGVPSDSLMGYWMPDIAFSLKEERDRFQARIGQLQEDFQRERERYLTRIESLEAQLEQACHSQAFAESMCEMLKKQINSLQEKETDMENG